MATHREAFADLRSRFGRLSATVPPVEGLIPSAIPGLDRLLGGGFPRGALLALEGQAGRWSIAARLLAQATVRGLAAVVDDGGLYPPTLAQAGVRLDRLLVVPASSALGVARAVDILVRSRACRVVLMPAVALRDAVWHRLAGLAHRSGVLLIAIADRAGTALSAAAGLRLHCVRERIVAHGSRGLWCGIVGYEIAAVLRKHKNARAGDSVRLRVVAAPDGAALRERAIDRRKTARIEARVRYG
jgi:hypothetical protein